MALSDRSRLGNKRIGKSIPVLFFDKEGNTTPQPTVRIKEIRAKVTGFSKSCDIVSREVEFCIVLEDDGQKGLISAATALPDLVLLTAQQYPITNPAEWIALADEHEYFNQVPRECDQFMVRCQGDPELRAKTIAFQGYGGQNGSNCKKLKFVANYTNALFGDKILWGLFDDPMGGPNRIVRPIQNLAEISNALCEIKKSSSSRSVPARSAKFRGYRNADCELIEPNCDGCCGPLECNKSMVPQASNRVPYTPGISKEICESRFTIKKPVLNYSGTCNFDTIKNSINHEGFLLYEYLRQRNSGNGNVTEPAICECYKIEAQTARVRDIKLTDAKWCCTDIKVLEIDLFVTSDPFCEYQAGHNAIVPNQGVTEISCDDCDGNIKLIPIMDSKTRRQISQPIWLDPCGKSIKESTGVDCDFVSDNQINTEWQLYDMIDFRAVVESDTDNPVCTSPIGAPPSDSCNCDPIESIPGDCPNAQEDNG